jgi:RimJ/RimL family protein N-acetyltransferase
VPVPDLVTPRLTLRHVPFDDLEARASSDVDDSAWLLMRAGQLRADPAYAPWSLRAVLLTEAGDEIGHAGFHARPVGGTVELGYTIFPAWRGHGFATEAAEGLMAFGRTHGATTFGLSIAPDNAASLAIAAKLGFVRTGEHIDERRGLEWVFRLG